MVIYEYNSNYLNILGALFWLLVIVAFIIGCVAFIPLLRKTIAPVMSYLKRSSTENASFPLSHSTQLYLSIITLLIYGVFLSGIIIGIFQAVSNSVEYFEMRNTQSANGRVHSINYEPFEYRGEEIGFNLQLYLDEQYFLISEPPGISANSLEVLQNSALVTVFFSSYKGNNVITKIVIE